MRMSRMTSSRITNVLIICILGMVLLGAGARAYLSQREGAREQCQPGPTRGFLHSVHGELVDASGCRVVLTGINWFGFETSTFAPHGLSVRNWQEMLDQIKGLGFNTIRLPFTNQLFDPSSQPTEINYKLNPDLKGLSGLALMDRFIQGARSRGLKIILDRHDPTADLRPELWYTDQVPQTRWMQDWVMLAQHYRGNDTVIGADLANEPHGPVTWGDGNPSTDWRLAAEQTGNAILSVNPDWLIIVEGIEQYQGDTYWWNGNMAGARQSPSDFYWWGGNLEKAKQDPVRLSKPGKLVYSAHDYGPEVYMQSWFQSPDFPHNLPRVWQEHWAYLQLEGIAPVLLGEFGGRSTGQDAGGVWQRSLVAFLKAHNSSYTYWSWNPDSGDTGGILQDDWKTVDQSKLRILSVYQWPVVGQR